MKEMKDRLRTLGSKSSMGIFDSAVLMALARKFAPAICVETGGNLGMSSSFILQGMHEAGIEAGKLLSVEVNPIIPVGSMIPERLKSGFTPMIGDVKQFMKKEVFPDQIIFSCTIVLIDTSISTWNFGISGKNLSQRAS
jgi:hypothetical protein